MGLDFDPNILFGGTTIPIARLSQRGVNSRHPQTVTKFCKRVISRCTQLNLADRLAALQSITHFLPQHYAELELIDKQLTQVLISADKTCTPANPVPWSPALNQAYLRHRLWTLELSAKRTKRDFSLQIQSIRNRLIPSPEDAADDQRSINANLCRAQHNLRKAKREADQLRRKHLDAILNEARAANKQKKSKALTHLIRAEQNRRCYAAFRSHTKPKAAGGLAYLTSKTDPQQPAEMILEPDEMDATLLDYSRTHFARAQGSPFTIDPLARMVQYDGVTPFGNLIFRGKVDLDALPVDAATRAVLKHLSDKLPLQTDHLHPINYDELQNGIKKWPEKTTTSPSGRHLGIYKSLQRHVLEKKNENQPSSTPPEGLTQGRDVLFLIFDVMSLALKHTYTLERWKTVWTIFIEKEPGNPDIAKLRCIMIFEADWQLLLKWHSLYGFLPKSETANALTSAQGGGRKGRSAIDQATQQVIESEIISLNQKPAINMFLDARHCFDLMVEACHNMACRRHGAAVDYLRLHAQTHKLMKYYVRHKYGVSVEYNTFEQHPWHGAGQGAADAALRYIVLSDTLIDAYHDLLQPWIISDPTTTLQVIKSLKAFIDDMAMSVGGDTLSILELAQRAQTQIQWWHQLVRVSGGALNPQKCCCMFYSWSPDKFGILRPTTPPPEAATISADDRDPDQHIQVLAPTEGTRYLGIYISQTGAAKTMETQLWKKAILYTRAFQRTHMSRREAGVLYRSCFLPALTYPLPAVWLSPVFLERIHQLSTSTILNKMGFHRNLPRSVVFAPRRLGGIGLCNLVHEHCAQQVIILLRHLRAGTPLGIAMEVLLRTYQLWAGLPQPVLVDTQDCPWIPDHWLTHLRASMHLNNIQIRHHAWIMRPLRLQDRYLMADFLDQGLSKSQLERLNACRMYLQVTTLSELTDHTGTELLPQILTNRVNPTPKGLATISQSTLTWPYIHPPSPTCWRLWTSTLCSIYTGSSKTTRLTRPLGVWLPEHDSHRFWHWRMHDTSHLVYRHSPSAPTRVALPTMTRRTSIKFSPTVPTTLAFTGPPITPYDPNTCYIRLPVAVICHPKTPPTVFPAITTIQTQF